MQCLLLLIYSFFVENVQKPPMLSTHSTLFLHLYSCILKTSTPRAMICHANVMEDHMLPKILIHMTIQILHPFQSVDHVDI